MTIYHLVQNERKQKSIWPDYRRDRLPSGWNFIGFSGSKTECLERIKNTDSPQPRSKPEFTANPEKATATPFPNEKATSQLFVFPHAGSGASYYHFLAKALQNSPILVRLVQYPGREMRVQEKAIPEMEIMLAQLQEELSPQMEKLPFSFFGHSMGALIAFELTRRLRKNRLPLPQKLFLSGRQAPEFPGDLLKVEHLNNADFLEAVEKRYHAIPSEILEHPEILQLILPSLRADFSLMEKYSYRRESPLDTPISLLNGSEDSWVSFKTLQAWQNETIHPLEQQTFPGDHFYLNESIAALKQVFLTEESSSR